MIPPIKLIGLVGHKRSGKDTVWSIISKFDASYLTRCKCYRESFGDDMKREIAELFGTTIEHLNKIKGHPTARNCFQFHGTEYGRNQIRQSYWIDKLAERMEIFRKLSDHCINLVITDVRMLDEAAFVKEQGGLLWRIRRKVADDVWDPHRSEAELDSIECDNFIHNDASFLRLECEVKDVMTELRHILTKERIDVACGSKPYFVILNLMSFPEIRDQKTSRETIKQVITQMYGEADSQQRFFKLNRKAQDYELESGYVEEVPF